MTNPFERHPERSEGTIHESLNLKIIFKKDASLHPDPSGFSSA
jgi:hypothetical protein